MLIILLVLVPVVRMDNVLSSYMPSGKRHLNNYKLNTFEPVQFVRNNKASKNGPILFPNDGPPPPPTPLIVTSRPLLESIQRSELNPNNSLKYQSQAQSQFMPVTFRPNHIFGTQALHMYGLDQYSVTPKYEDDRTSYRSTDIGAENNDAYDDYDVKTSLQNLVVPINKSPIKNKIMKYQRKPISTLYRGIVKPNVKPFYNYQFQPPAEVLQQPFPPVLSTNKLDEETSTDFIGGEDFAFSYTVKDKKTGDDFSHTQQSSGSTTNGQYRVRLPDGRTQVVSYIADENGYKADVRYDEHVDEEQTKAEVKPVIENDFEDDIENRIETPLEHRVPHSKIHLKTKDNIYFDYIDKNVLTRHKDHSNNYITDHAGYSERVHDKVTDSDKYIPLIKVNFDTKRHPDYYENDSEDMELSKESNDYSTEIDYVPYKSKFKTLVNKPEGFKPNVNIPSNNLLKNVFITRFFKNTQNHFGSTTTPKYIADEISSEFAPGTQRPSLDSTTEKNVLISTKRPDLYTNIRNIFSASSASPDISSYTTPSPLASPIPITTRYLIPTLANLKNDISSTPVLSNSYITKINKYLTFN